MDRSDLEAPERGAALSAREALRLLERGIFVIDPDGRVLLMNAVAERILGRTEAEAMGRSGHALWHHSFPDGTRYPASECPIYAALREGHPYGGLDTFWTAAGDPVLVDLAVNPMNAAGRWIGSLVVFKDVLATRIAEEALNETDARSRIAADHLPMVVWTTDLDLRFTSAMGGALRGRPSEALGRTYQEFTDLHDPAAPPIAAHLMALTGKPGSFVANFRGRVFRSHVDALRRGDEIIGVIGAALDVTDEISAREEAIETHYREMEARKELRRAQSDYRALVESIPGISYIDSLSTTTRTIFVSPQLQSVVGFAPEDVLADPRLWLKRLHPDDRDRVIAERVHHYQQGSTFNSEYRVMANDGRIVWVIDQAIIVRDNDGTPIFSHGVIHDITERKQIQEEAENTARLDALGRLAAGIAHDFNNLLTSILGNCHLLLEDPPVDSDNFHALQDINSAAEIGRDIVAQLMGFTGRLTVGEHVAEVNQVVRSLKFLLSRLLGEDLELDQSLSETPLEVSISKGELEQIVLNLLVNAREAMPDGGTIKIRTGHVPGDGSVSADETVGPGLGLAMLEVSDTGVGMDEETQKRIFEPFFSTKDRAANRATGLGLATVYGIVRRHGGRIDVTSEPGRGTSISIQLPLSSDTTDVISLDPADGFDGHDRTVLLVEDEPPVRTIARRALERAGATVLEAEDGDSALAIAHRHRGPIDLLLTDVMLKGMNGRELHQALLDGRADLPVLYMSGDADDVIFGAGIGPDDELIKKPFTPADLVERIAVTLTKRSSELGSP